MEFGVWTFGICGDPPGAASADSDCGPNGLSSIMARMVLPRARSLEEGWFHEVQARVRAWWGAKLVGTTGGMAVFFVAYFWVLRHPHFAVSIMPLTPVDRAIGIWSAAVPIYLSLWFYISLAPALLRDGRELASYAVAAVVLSVVGLGCFFFWPTAVPTPEVEWSRYSGLSFLKAADAAGNACPSLHVAFAVFSACWFERSLRELRAGPMLRAANWLWCVGILFSTIAVRQHVFLDVVSGTALGAMVAIVHFAWLRSGPKRGAA